MASIFKPRYNKFDAEKGRTIKRRLRKWYVRYKDHDGILRTVPGYTDKEATKQLAARLERDAARRQEGIISPHESQQKRPLAEHIDDFRRYLAAKGNCPEHVARTTRHVESVCAACRFLRIADIQPSAVVEHLANLRKASAVSLVDQTADLFTVKDVSRLLNINVDSVHRLVKRGLLPCQGTRRTKRFHRTDVEAVIGARAKGIGVETSNHYLVAMKEFSRWLVRNQRIGIDPLAHLSRLNPDVDVRRQRRALPEQQFSRFVEATAQGKPFRGLMGADRLVLYVLAAQTGFRANELASLEPASFTFDAKLSTVKVNAAYSKHRREDVQPLRSDVAEVMRQYVAGKPIHQRLWPGTWAKAAAEMVRLDLGAAGIPYRDDNGRLFDFHALRGQFISFLAAKGVHPKVAQVLARHSSITLTMDFYTHLDVLDVAGALDQLPKMPGCGAKRQEKIAG